jgi:hypothetical protein
MRRPVAHQRRLPVVGEALEAKGGEDGEADQPQRLQPPRNEHLVDDRLHQPGAQRGRPSDQHHKEEGERQPTEIWPDVFADQPAHQLLGRTVAAVYKARGQKSARFARSDDNENGLNVHIARAERHGQRPCFG